MDIRTLVFILAFTTALNAAVVLFLARKTRIPGVKEWGLGTACVSLGLLLVGLRGGIDGFFSIALSNELVLMGYAVVWIGMRRFVGRVFSIPVVLLSALIVGGSFAGLYYYSLFEPSLAARSLIISGSILFFSTAICTTLSSEKLGRSAVTFAGAMYGLNCLINAFRCIQPVLSADLPAFLVSGSATIAYFGLSILFSLSVMVGQILMIKEEMGGPSTGTPITKLFFSTSEP